MRRTFHVVAVVLTLASLPQRARAQVSLTGTYVTYMAVGSNGCMVDATSMHSMAYTETGSPPTSCDASFPGSPWEGFQIEATGPSGAITASNLTTGAGSFTTTTPTAAVGRNVTWSGTYASGATSLRVDETFTYQTDDRAIQLTFVLTNTGTGTLTDVYYERHTDPDLGSCTGGSGYATDNDVLLQPPTDMAALITSGATTPGGYLLIGLGANDARARASLGSGGAAAAEWTTPTDPAGASADEYADLIFHEPSLAPGAAATFVMDYVWGPDTATVQMRLLGLGSTPCAGADGSACTGMAGATGTCHALRCCTGCWDGTRCNPPGTSTACGVGGGSCTSCVDADPCTNDVCGAITGTCTHPPAAMGVPCDDHLFCTATDECNGAGTCVGGGAPCDDGNPCTSEMCNESSHACSGHTPLPDGAACAALPAGVCHAGACCSGCWDGSACHAGTAAAQCGIAGAACTSCVDSQPCTDDVCTLGACTNPNSSASTACDDGLYCTTGDHCDGMNHCSSGASTPCDDGSTCTTDGCDEASHGCTHMPAMGICAIFGSCFPAGTMNPSNPCQVCDPTTSASGWSPAAAGATCGLPSCSGTMLTPAPTCSAAGVCTPSARMPCAGGTCASATMCATMCTMDANCGSTGYCDMTSGMCAPRLAPGTECDRTTECETGVCSTDGHCCVAACAGMCESCAVPGNLGRCLPVPAGTDPDGECGAGMTCTATGNCAGGAVDAGTPPDAGAPRDAGAVDGSPPPTDAGLLLDGSTTHDAGVRHTASGGCCNVAGASNGEGALALCLLGLALTAARRRRHEI